MKMCSDVHYVFNITESVNLSVEIKSKQIAANKTFLVSCSQFNYCKSCPKIELLIII